MSEFGDQVRQWGKVNGFEVEVRDLRSEEMTGVVLCQVVDCNSPDDWPVFRAIELIAKSERPMHCGFDKVIVEVRENCVVILRVE